MPPVRRWVLRLLIGQLVWAVLMAWMTAQDYGTLERRIADVDKDLSGRVRVLESDMAEVKWLARGVAAAVMGQLVLAGLKERKAR